jgi:myo-inositol 2-dehydrogenase / D-chiro-inositol 1-dehydrogenase
MSNESNKLDRRDFMAAAGAATAGLLLVKPEIAFGTRANSTMQVGLIGCGGRGSAVTGDFVGRAGCRVAALGDLFQDALDKAKANFDAANQKQGKATIDAKHLFKGPKSCQELCNSDVDVVVIGTPPYFHPDHLEVAVQAKKHIYLEKPVATDVRGARKVMDLARKADPQKSVHVGFQIRYSPEYREMTRRIHEGAIGDIASVQAYYLAGDLPRRPAGASPMETKLRNWFFDKALSGDVLVEQNIHIIDWINWVLQAKPEKAFGTAGRKVRTDIGDVNDHFVTVYKYPKGINVGFQSTQYLPKWGDVVVRFMGSKGFAEAHYSGIVQIVGANEWKAAPPPATAARQRPEVDPLAEATPEKVKSFVGNIQAGKYENQLVQGAESTLSAILGRQACYKGKEMTWDQVFKSNQTWKTDVIVEKLG